MKENSLHQIPAQRPAWTPVHSVSATKKAFLPSHCNLTLLSRLLHWAKAGSSWHCRQTVCACSFFSPCASDSCGPHFGGPWIPACTEEHCHLGDFTGTGFSLQFHCNILISCTQHYGLRTNLDSSPFIKNEEDRKGHSILNTTSLKTQHEVFCWSRIYHHVRVTGWTLIQWQSPQVQAVAALYGAPFRGMFGSPSRGDLAIKRLEL